MTIEETKKAIEVMQAFVDGKKIEFRCDDLSEWEEVIEPFWCFGKCDYRIKPEPRYRPFKSAEEVMEAIKEHGDWLVFHDPKGDYYHHISAVLPERKDLGEPLRVRFNGGTHRIDPEDYTFYKFADGTPFGVKEKWDMKATELVATIQRLVEQYGDREIEISGEWHCNYTLNSLTKIPLTRVDLFDDSSAIQILVDNFIE